VAASNGSHFLRRMDGSTALGRRWDIPRSELKDRLGSKAKLRAISWLLNAGRLTVSSYPRDFPLEESALSFLRRHACAPLRSRQKQFPLTF
jgi:hypothetical protein